MTVSSSGLDYTDLFCGAGGSSIGLSAAGLELRLAANHWSRAIETHAANFPDAEHLCADINHYDMRRLPRTRVLWASPICTEASPAGGRRRRARGQLALLEFGPVERAGFERTRATFHDVIRATEVHRYDAVIVENVPEVATCWELFDWWVAGMCSLRPGYQVQYVSVSSAHVGGPGNPWAPQWRDRLYLVFTRAGVPAPDVDPRPVAWCPACDTVVYARQAWKRPGARRIGKYRQQYVYACPNTTCRHTRVEPYVLPAAAAIDWTNLGTRIGDRTRPLAPATLRRIRIGLQRFAQPVVATAAGNTYERPGSGYVRAWPAGQAPLMARTCTAGDAVAVPPFMVPAGGTWRTGPAALGQPMPARTARDTDGMVVPPVLVNTNHDDDRVHPADARPLPTATAKIGYGLAVPGSGVEPFVTMLRRNATVTGLGEPLATVTTGGERGGAHHYLTVPPDLPSDVSPGALPGVAPGAFYVKNYGGNARPEDMARPVGYPLGTVTGRDHHALVVPYYRTGTAKPTGRPLDTVTSRDRFALVEPAGHPPADGDGVQLPAVEDCRFRMLQPREHLRAQRFPDTYTVAGNKGEQTMQAGNAVSANVAQWLGQQIAAALEGGGS